METILLERADGVATITLNRPELKNAANGLMWEELLAAFDDVASTPEGRQRAERPRGKHTTEQLDAVDEATTP
jgi:enoyl-CoA hydratase/carnithine racemase